MDLTLVGALIVATFLAVIAFATWSKKRTEEAMNDRNHSKSTLAEDAPNERKNKSRGS